MTAPRPADQRDRGSATLFALAVIGLLALVGGALGVVAAMVHAHRVAQSAADLAALAGAQALVRGADPCSAAATIATANGATLDTCATTAADVTVQVSVRGPHWLAQRHDLSAQARAGPA
ncbi:flp pilus-assembly TadE/G-like family protein [Nocardioides anomalus]|uniref:Flp pilus-assembly TadE/G-like family protein n=1 Tax=Nocardioides anomalus TaxID=2712223 RepID=A0A6G6WI30_9ACTN|nr:Rv3654c family TadE-like protein [Nocardioides anomalus]QIG44894.1 flp pilus-assembly TadE/G-like family protein [Nocardioides anomalus]